jgi:glycosyltransferase involved in cell wall biosynthesis
MAVAELLGCSYSFTAHARDIYWTPNALPDKIRAARFVVTCTRYNQDYLRRICPDVPQAHIVMIRHGIEPPASKEPAPAPGRWSPSERPMLLSAGRLIAKKGFDVLIDACAILRRRGIGFACAIAGDGPLETALRRKIARLELDGLVQLIGWQPYSRMAELYQNATMFLLPSRVTDTGDRDGTPNVLIEALAFGLPCISTSVSGIPELIEHGRTGLLIPQDNPEAVAEAVESLLRSPEFATDLGRMGRRKVLEEFDLKTNTLQLARLFSLRTA